MSLSKAESDVILNRANVALSRSQRLVSSWLPTQTEDELSNLKSEEELQREEDEIFTAVPETLGIGAPLPEKAADGSWNRTELSSNDKLRKQLLGKNYDRFMKIQAENKAQAKVNISAPQGAKPVVVEESSDDEEEGRTTSVGMRRKNGQSKMKTKTKMTTQAEAETEAVEKEGGQDQDQDTDMQVQGDGQDEVPVATKKVPVRQAPSKNKKKATSYLDEILAQRANKRKKR
ncbi:hypothetical protein N7478_009110 [Penicillium angulare]|uniref:uncharacterized protein n=1 Tax=Penicillium angulare TaxID=116970 RepID=UPI0025425EBF|nr:uncharacterized protein N7478_009110 [Penicillium angulare]KAJ5273985.1 hypothetical protein N7478_009110 [Penicillium angulare]